MKIFLRKWAPGIGLFLFFVLAHNPQLAASEPIAVIVNKQGPLNSISTITVREIYLGEIRFLRGTPIVPLHYPEGPVKERFLEEFIHHSPRAYKLHWTKKVFQEGLSLPLIQSSPSEIIDRIRKTPGGIGYVPMSHAAQVREIQILFSFDP
jgi:ABC-type phosphate transport system substrate-binding protein